jgi:predicted nucleic-acid-binding Zn-ribbon protein
MQDIRIDAEGNHRCWKCGSKNFDEKRTFRSKAFVGVGALMTHKKLKCQDCGEYNDTGHAKPFTGPAGTLTDRMEASKDRMEAWTAKSNEKIGRDAEGKHHACGALTFKEQVAADRAAIRAKKEAKKAALGPAAQALNGHLGAATPKAAPEAASPAPSLSVADELTNRQPEPVPAVHGVADELRKLGELRDSGLLTDEEFVAQKAKLLGT